MKFVRDILDRIVLLAAVVAAGCIPSFIVQYRQRAGGRLDQVLADLAPFQEIADRNHGGSLSRADPLPPGKAPMRPFTRRARHCRRWCRPPTGCGHCWRRSTPTCCTSAPTCCCIMTARC
jgi:hypothetical protein